MATKTKKRRKLSTAERAEKQGRDILALVNGFQAELRKGAKKAMRCRRRRLSSKAKWPIVSEMHGCHPDQVEEGNKRIRERGGMNGSYYNKQGRIVWPSQRAQTAWLKSTKQRNYSSFTH